jgi:DNA-directed RNA polymerase subunit M/transcription elongation factor TFIIS
MADYFRFSCPQCGQRLKAKTDAVGRQAHCKRCGAQFDVPDPTTSKHDPSTPRTHEASLAAAETDPAPMVLKDQTSANYQPTPPRHKTPALTTPHKGCGRALGLAGFTVVVGCAVIGVTAYGIGNKGSATSSWPAETTGSPSRRPSDISHQKSAVVMPAVPPRPKPLSKSKASPRSPSGVGRS